MNKNSLKIIIYVYDGLTMLDAIGPYEVLRSMNGAEIYFVGENKGEIKADSGFISIKTDYDIKSITDADILVIPGSTVGFLREMKNKKVLDWIKKVDKTTTWTVSVCSGSLLLAAGGLLDGLKATSHWKPIHLLHNFGAIPVRERIVEQGKYITSAGVSAGIDMALYLSDKIVGENETKSIQLTLEYDPQPLYHSGNFLEADKEIIKMAEGKLKQSAKQELGLKGLIKHSKELYKIEIQ